MEESNYSTGCSDMFDNDALSQQADWDHLLRNKVKFDKWKNLEDKNVKTHMRKSKDEMLDQLEKEA